jgi:imidazolonepropionase
VNDLNVVRAAELAVVADRGVSRRGREQRELELISDGAVAIRGGRIAAVGRTADVLREWGQDGVQTFDASGKTVLPGLIECHSHPLFSGNRHAEYQLRLDGASLAEVAAAGGGIWSTVVATRDAADADLIAALDSAYRRILAGGVTTLEVKSGYGLTPEHELHQLDLLDRSREITPLSLVISYLGAHVVPEGVSADAYTNEVLATLPAVIDQGFAEFHDITCEAGLFTPEHAAAMFEASRKHGIPTKAHADAWTSSHGWETAVEGGAVSAEHLTYTPDEEIRRVGATDTIAVLLPQAELVYMTERRANARLLIDQEVPVAIATDYCSSIHATSLTTTLGLAAPWFRMTAAEVIVGATLNAAYALRLQTDRGSLEVGKRGDLTVLDIEHPNELTLAVGQSVVADVVIDGAIVTKGTENHHAERNP